MVYQEILFKTLTNKFWKWKMKIQPVSYILFIILYNKVSIRIGRKIIVDYIEGQNDINFEDWKFYQKLGNKKNQITSWVPKKPGKTVKQKVITPI